MSKEEVESVIYELLSEGIPKRRWIEGEWKPTYEVSEEEIVKIVSKKLGVSERNVCEALDRLLCRGSIVRFNGYYMLKQYSQKMIEQLKDLLNTVEGGP
jgi:hypothetical protein